MNNIQVFIHITTDLIILIYIYHTLFGNFKNNGKKKDVVISTSFNYISIVLYCGTATTTPLYIMISCYCGATYRFVVYS